MGSSFLAKKQELSGVQVIHGIPAVMDSDGDIDQDQIFINDDPMMVLMEFARLKNLRMVDLFSAMDKDHSGSISYSEMREGLLVGYIVSKQCVNLY